MLASEMLNGMGTGPYYGPVRPIQYGMVRSPTSYLIGNGILKELTAAGEGVGHIKSESIRYGLNKSIEGVIEVYKSIVEGNV